MNNRGTLPDKVAVRATARLHLGFLDLNGSLGRHFGSIGLALDQPAIELSLKRSATEQVSGPEHIRATAHLRAMQRHLDLTNHYELILHEAIPAHAGLGSGTQLALAVAAAVRQLEGFDISVPGDAQLLQRGARSGAGAGLFAQGGLIIDGGHGARKGTPPVLARMGFPDSWRVLVIMDKGIQGVHGEAERAAFAALPQFQASAAADICHHVLMQALPALAEHDISQFGAAITQIQMILGDYFAPAQGGRYTSPAVGKIMSALDQAGAYGLGQSSWGPTGFAFVETEAKAEQLVRQISHDAASLHVNVLICKGMNSGAKIKASMAAKDREHLIQPGK